MPGYLRCKVTDEVLFKESKAKKLSDQFPFIEVAVDAHLERQPTTDSPGRPIESLIQIKKELNTDKFGPIFQEFCKREAIYGFGDLQVKKLLDQVNL